MAIADTLSDAVSALDYYIKESVFGFDHYPPELQERIKKMRDEMDQLRLDLDQRMWSVMEAEGARADPTDDEDLNPCTNPGGHHWVVRDDNEEISYCEYCGADGNG